MQCKSICIQKMVMLVKEAEQSEGCFSFTGNKMYEITISHRMTLIFIMYRSDAHAGCSLDSGDQ